MAHELLLGRSRKRALRLASSPPMAHLPPVSREIAELRRRLAHLSSAAAVRRAGALVVQRLPGHLGITAAEVAGVLGIGAAIARDASGEELTTFLRTGRLPEVVVLSPAQMEHVRGGRLDLTATRGIVPAQVLEHLRDVP